VDTRSKIVTLEEAQALARPVAVVSGSFDVLCAEHARELQDARNRAAGGALLVAVLPSAAGVLGQRARAEMVAALRMVDYVVTADYEDLDRIIHALSPTAVVRLEAADERRTRQLIEHVHRRQNR
jgi:bifunctional ADP-heptose synthase (sugar kinase/adenylyltransferase)